MDFDFDALFARAAEVQAEQAERAQPLRTAVKWPVRHARGGHRQSAQQKARKAQDWLLEKVHSAEDKLFWEQAEKRVGIPKP